MLLITAFLFGALFALGFPNLYLPPLFLFPLLSFLGLFYLWQRVNQFEQTMILRKKGLIFLSFALGSTFFCYYWLAYTLVEFGGVPKSISYILTSIYAFIIFPQGWCYLAIDHLLFKYPKLKNRIPSLQFNLILAALYSLIEYSIPEQFPSHIGNTYLNLSPYLGLTPYLGAVIFSFFSFWFILESLTYLSTKKFSKFFIVFTVFFILTNIVLKLEKKSSTLNLNLRLVQANVGNYLKVQAELGDPASFRTVISDYLTLSHSDHAKDYPLDLIVWPETAYPEIINAEMVKTGKQLIPSAIKEVIEHKKSYLYVGGYDFDNSNLVKNPYFEKDFNSGFLFDRSASLLTVYNKQKLLNFGETLPFGPFNEKLSEILTSVSFFARGKGPTLFTLEKNGTPIYFISAICYEILFPEMIRKQLNSFSTQAHFIMNITNDSWYGNSAEPYQHLYLAHWRSLEFQIPVIRSTNTGITSILYPDGSESTRLNLFEKKVLDLPLPLPIPKATPYQKYGILCFILFWSLLFLFSILTFKYGEKFYEKVKTHF
ncbi:MAG: apolipoprotein N-acyltransferase [Bacteriovoracaceae bacterium]